MRPGIADAYTADAAYFFGRARLQGRNNRHSSYMVAYDSRRTPDPSRSLSPEALERLTRALQATSLAEHPSATAPDADGDVTAALASVATEARERGLRPEELIIVIKQLEDLLTPPEAVGGADARRRVRERIVSACLRAYFGG